MKLIVEFLKLNRSLKKIEDIIIREILRVMLDTKIVANNILGFSINFKINLCLLKSESLRIFLSLGLSEKKLISDPEIMPEQKSKETQVKI